MFISVPVKRKRRKNKKRKAFRHIRKTKRYLKRKRRVNPKHLRRLLEKKYNLTKSFVGNVFINIKRRNTFINISRCGKNKVRNKYGRRTKKPRHRVKFAASMGYLKIYRGRAKTSPVAKKALASLLL